MSEVAANNRIHKAVRAILCGLPAASLATLAMPALAQQAPAQQAPADSGQGEQLQEVVVTGLKASLQQSLDIKRNADGIVDAISAQDIGQFPDSNLAQALERIPGVTVTHASTDMAGVAGSTGVATQVTVRGFGPQFNETLYDGRQVPVSTGDRSFDFGSLGSDLVGELDVLKTPDSSLSSGAIGATINIKFPKPFDRPGFQLAGSLAAQDSTGADKVTPNGSLLISDTFADNRFGVLLAGAYTDNKTRGNHVDIQGWEGTTALTAAEMANGATPPANAWYIQDYGIYQEQNEDKHEGGRLVLQARPVDGLELTLDDNFSRETLTQVQHGFSAWFNGPGAYTNVTTAPDGTITSFNQAGTSTDFQAAINGGVIRDNSLGFNVKWDLNEHNSVMFDAYTAVSQENPGGQLSQLDADIGYGNANTALDSDLGVVVPGGSNALPYPVNYGPSGNAAAFTGQLNGQNIIGSHDIVLESIQNANTINQFKLEGAWHDDNTKLKYGVQFTHDAMYLRDYSDFNTNWNMYENYGDGLPPNTGVSLTGSGLNLASTFGTGSGFINGWSNGGNLPPNILAVNGYSVLNYLQSLKGVGSGGTSCTPSTVPCSVTYPTGMYSIIENTGGHQNIIENTLAPYISLTTKAQIASMPLKITMGARWEDTKLDSFGIAAIPGNFTEDPAAAGQNPISMTPPNAAALVDAKNEYRYLLPNLDLDLSITDTLDARFDVSRTMTRPPLSDLTPTLNVPYTTQRAGALQATGGNPDLLPYLSDNVDLGAQWYYARNSYLSADAFVKELTNFIVGGTVQETIPAFGTGPAISYPNGQAATFNVTSNVNGPSAEVRGIELAVQHMFWDTGFGFSANATFVGTNKPYDPNDVTQSGFAVTGLANSYNFVPFYEKHGFMIRLAVNHQNAFLNNFGQHQPNSAFGAEPVFVNAATYVDLSTSYQITRQLSVSFEALNLTNQAFSTHGRFQEQVLDVVDTGRTFNLGVHFKL